MSTMFLDPIGAGFLHTESRQQMNHVASMLIYKVPEGKDADVAASEMHQNMLSYEAALPPFGSKLGMKLGQYIWEEDDEFDISNHVRHVSLPYPRDMKELDKMVGLLHGIQMDRSLPMWVVYIISGLPDNKFAVYGKLHHALVDGIAGARLIQSVHSEDPNEMDLEPFWAFDREKMKARAKGKKTAAKAKTEVKNEASQSSFSKVTEMFSSVTESGQKVLGQLFKNIRNPDPSTNYFPAPKTILNQKVTGARRFSHGSFEIDRMKAVGKKIDGSLNDVLLLMTSYTIRKYLKDLAQLPKEDMYITMPVSLRRDDSVGGNQVTLMRAKMGTNVAHTNKRIEIVRQNIEEQKAVFSKMSAKELEAYAMLTSAGPTITQITPLGTAFELLAVNLMLSNVPGPKNKLYMNGLEVESMHPISIPFHQMAVNFTVLSYDGMMNLGITGCRTRLPHLQRMMPYMYEGLEDLEIATGIKKRG